MTGASDPGLLLVAFAILGVALGGSAAIVAGRALALGWRSFAIAPFYMIALAGAVGFLHYALFGLSVIPLYDIGAAIKTLPKTPAAAVLKIVRDAIWWATLSLALTGFAYAGYRGARAAQMAQKYGWLFERRRFFFWRRKKA